MTQHDDRQTTVLPADGQPASEGSESAWAALVGVGIAGIAALVFVFRPHRLTFLVGTILLLLTVALGALVAATMALAAITPRTGPVARRALAAPPASGLPGRRLSGWAKPQNWVKLVTVLAALLLAASTVLTVVHKHPVAAHHHHHHHARHHHAGHHHKRKRGAGHAHHHR